MTDTTRNDLPAFLEKNVILDADSATGRVFALMDELQMIAWEHASALRVAFAELMEQNRMWVLARLYVQLPEALPGDREFILHTWPVGLDKRQAYREFVLLLPDSREPVARATSSWSVLDRDTRQPVEMTEVLDGHLPDHSNPPVIAYPGRVIPKLKAADGEAAVTVGEDDIDINGHVNNLRYLGWALDSLPDIWKDEHELAAVDVQFRAECFAGDALCVTWGADGDERRLHAVSRADNGREVARLTTAWRRRS